MQKYQLLIKPTATATGEPGRWSFVAHGAAYTKEEADAHFALIEKHSPGCYKTKRLPL